MPECIEGESLPGLSHIPHFLSRDEQENLHTALRQRKRRKMQVDDFGKFEVICTREPPELSLVRKRIMALGILQGLESPVQVNWYEQGKGISDHVDNPRIRHGAILTLGASCVVHFRRSLQEGICTRLLVMPGDVYTLVGEAREAVHGIVTASMDDFRGKLYPRIGTRTAVIFGTLRETESADAS
jgi:alkylated DNA repair dioxygenase AlkB